ncbi:hypothetical protein PoB_003527700 [Plakobranchus ocellatus]|uniref:Prolactin receptor n=1 Tax=Plakobranchus ocellatus TaxID=259542 RepID=A0AAV4APD2_9GAST|nr:hypothetical protein PoB_003527700 [Plakobranchus ocellatus]
MDQPKEKAIDPNVGRIDTLNIEPVFTLTNGHFDSTWPGSNKSDNKELSKVPAGRHRPKLHGDLLPSNANQVSWEMKGDLTLSKQADYRTRPQFLQSHSNRAGTRGDTTVLQNLATAICHATGVSVRAMEEMNEHPEEELTGFPVAT